MQNPPEVREKHGKLAHVAACLAARKNRLSPPLPWPQLSDWERETWRQKGEAEYRDVKSPA